MRWLVVGVWVAALGLAVAERLSPWLSGLLQSWQVPVVYGCGLLAGWGVWGRRKGNT